MSYSFSIIVPVHNSKKTIRRCVDSLLNQDVDKQIILIENGSTDESLIECKKILAENKGIVELYTADDVGVSNARNIGLMHANGDIICFCDADDYYDKNVLIEIEQKFKSLDVDIVITSFTIVTRECNREIKCKKEEIISKNRFIEYLMCYTPIMGSVWNKFYKRRVIINKAFFPSDLHYMEDTYFNFLVAEQNNNIKISIILNNTYYYVRNDNSVTNSINNFFDNDGNMYSNKTRKLIMEKVLHSTKEKEYVKDAICQESILAIKRYGNVISDISYNKLFDDIKFSYLVFLKRIFKFDYKKKIKYALFAVFILIKGKRNT